MHFLIKRWMQWTVFDLEFTHLLPNIGEEWPSDLHITCGSIFSTGDTMPSIWYEDANYMSVESVGKFVDALFMLHLSGHKIVTWGGSSSDWRMLSRECKEKDFVVRELALNSIDIPMCSCMSIGVMMSLRAASTAVGLELKNPEDSKSMPEIWSSNRQKVLEHVSHDSYATFIVLAYILGTGTLPWVTNRGQRREWNPVHLMSVRECLTKDIPSTPYKIEPRQNAKLLARWLLF